MTVTQASILLVDDRPENLVALQAILHDLREKLVSVSSGEEALKQVLKQEFAVILLDVQMSGMDGFETAALIKQREKSMLTPIIFITAINRSESHVFKGYSLGAVDYIFKPVDPEILKMKVSVFVDLFKKRMQIAEINQQLQEQVDRAERLNRDLETLNRELESFSYSVSHDLRTPLRSIRSFSQALVQDHQHQLDEQGQDYLHRIYMSSQRMTELIDDLLKLSRLTRGRLHQEKVNLSEIANDILTHLQALQPQREVSTHIEDDLYTEGDKRLLRLLLENLLQNAWKFTSHHTSANIYMGRQDGEDGQTIFYISDDGAGFDMQYADQLFSPFQRFHTDDEFEGTGIGLATVQRIVHRHGGQIWAEAGVEKGATFFFTL
jgi:two-component system, sensor histidine kinase and response regulator